MDARIVGGDEIARRLDNGIVAAPINQQLMGGDVFVSLLEGKDVARISATPLVDRLVIIPHDTDIFLVGDELDQLLLNRVNVLVLINRKEGVLPTHLCPYFLVGFQGIDGDAQYSGKIEKAFLFKFLQIDRIGVSEAVGNSLVRGQPFLAENVDVSDKGLEDPVLGGPTERFPVTLFKRIGQIGKINVIADGGKERKAADIVQHVVGAVAGDEFLEESKGKGVDGADIHITNVRLFADQHLDFRANPKLQLFGGFFGKGKGNDLFRLGDTFVYLVGDSLRNKFGFSSAGTSDDLEVTIEEIRFFSKELCMM